MWTDLTPQVSNRRHFYPRSRSIVSWTLPFGVKLVHHTSCQIISRKHPKNFTVSRIVQLVPYEGIFYINSQKILIFSVSFYARIVTCYCNMNPLGLFVNIQCIFWLSVIVLQAICKHHLSSALIIDIKTFPAVLQPRSIVSYSSRAALYIRHRFLS